MFLRSLARTERIARGEASQLESERLQSLDLLRGIAVLGILVPNIVGFGQPLEASFSPSLFVTDPGPFADQLWAVQFVAIDGKMRGLFELLFGASMMLFVERSWARGQSRLLQARRLAILGAFGLMHGTFLWAGDVLWSYAVVGMVALWFLHLPAASLAILAAITAVVGALLSSLAYLPIVTLLGSRPAPDSLAAKNLAALTAEAEAIRADSLVETEVIRAGDYAAFVRHNVDYVLSSPIADAAYAGMEVFPLILIGAALYKAGLFSGRKPPSWLARIAAASLIGGVAASLAAAIATLRQGLGYWPTSLAAGCWAPLPIMLITFGIGVLCASRAGRAKGLLAHLLQGAGKTAFSNYIGTSAIMLVVFHGFGLGLFGYLSRIELYLLVLPAWAIMLTWPQFWLRHFRYGPLEWLWRCLTYGRLCTLRRGTT